MPLSLRRRLPAVLASLVAALLAAGTLPVHANDPGRVETDNPRQYTNPHAGLVAPPRVSGRLAPATGALLGTHSDDSHTGALTEKDQGILRTEASTGRRMDIDNSYYEFDAITANWVPGDPNKRGLSKLAYWDKDMGRVPLVGWACGRSHEINAGQHDALIRKTGEAFKAFGAEFFMRYCWEMDGSKRIMDEDVDPDIPLVGEPDEFIRAWTRIYDIIVNQVGATNVIWVWCGNAAHFKDSNDAGHHAWDYYPGDQWVDWISSDGYNWAASIRNKNAGYDRDRWRGLVEIFDEFMAWARSTGPIPASIVDEIKDRDPSYDQTVFPNKTQMKPIMIGEYGTIEPEGDIADHYLAISPYNTKQDWIREAHDTVNGTKARTGDCFWCGIYSDIAAMVYFDVTATNGEWIINSSPESIAAYTEAARDPWFNQIHTLGWAPAANRPDYVPPVQQPPVQQPPVQQPPVQQPPVQQPPVQQPPAAERSGYWMLGSDGKVYPFGAATSHGDAVSSAAVDIEPTPSGNGYWIVDSTGRVSTHGDAGSYGSVNAGRLVTGETVTSLSSTPSGKGYWIFTSRGGVLNFGDAVHHGDVSAVKLNGPVLDSIPTPSGKGYYMVASDGGIFSFGDAKFYGSMGAIKLNAPVQSLVPDPDGVGYWLVASDGGVFSFEGAFRGSMGGKALNKPVTGMVPYGNGYLMVAEDGGMFNFSDQPFSGSLGGRPPAKPIVAVAPL